MMLRTIADLLFGWWNWFGRQALNVWNLVLLSLMWTVWSEHNRHMIENVESSTSQLRAIFISTLFH